MKHALLIVGESITFNKIAMNYIYRSYETHFGEIKFIYFALKSDKELPFMIERFINKFDVLSIVASNDSFATVSKIIATLSDDTLELKNETLVPSNVKKVIKGSFVIKFQKHSVNVLKFEENCLMPNFLIPVKENQAYFTLLDIDEDSFRILLEPLAKTFEVKLSPTSIIPNWLLVKVTSNKFGQIEGFIQSAKMLFPQKLFLGKDPIKNIINSLIKSQKQITTAESCTGGLIASMITSVPGSSQIFNGSLVTYSNHIKNSWLGVDEEILTTRGAVSEACVEQMLQGALKTTSSNFALATSGIAGPSGASEEKPVGTVFVGVCNKEKSIIERLLLKGDRAYIQEQSAYYAFSLLLKLESELFSTQ